MRAAVIDKPGQVRVGEVPDPTPGLGQVIVQVEACGVCGTDLHIAAGEFPPTPYPIVPGHEFAGSIVAIGPGAAGIRMGDRVAVDPSIFCRYCWFCRVGKGNLCENWNATGDTVDGGFAQYVAVAAANCYQLPEQLSFRQGALIEPLSCAVHGLHRLAPQPGDRALVVGAGTMGLLLVQLLARTGATEVAVVDTNAARLPLATRMSATATGTSLAEVADTAPRGFDLVVDATGVAPAIESALGVVKRGGKFLVFGVAAGDASVAVSPFQIYNDEITVLGSMAVLNSFQPALDLLATGAVEADALLSHALPLESYPEALDTVRRGEGVKVQVLPTG
jgi:2-desacetyl-2-hydroxyethyl bacteriochlorophyllide A dehydrogenase